MGESIDFSKWSAKKLSPSCRSYWLYSRLVGGSGDDELLDRIEANLKLGLQRLLFDIGDVWSHLRQHQVDQLRAVGAFDHVGVIDVELGVVVEEIPLLEVVSVGVVDDPVEVVVPRAVGRTCSGSIG